MNDKVDNTNPTDKTELTDELTTSKRLGKEEQASEPEVTTEEASEEGAEIVKSEDEGNSIARDESLNLANQRAVESREKEVEDLAEGQTSPIDDEGALNKMEEGTERRQTREGRKSRKPKHRLRLIPIWLRIIISIVLIGGCLLLGMIVGYGVIGDGDPADALKPETWYHIINIIRGV